MDPQSDVIEFLRTVPDLDGIIEDLAGLEGAGGATFPDMRAVFRSRLPEQYRVGPVPCLIVDPMQEGAASLGSFSSRTPQVFIPIRMYAEVLDDGDTDLSTAAMSVRNLFLTPRFEIAGGELVDVDCGFPEDTETSGPEIAGRRFVVTMLIQEAVDG